MAFDSSKKNVIKITLVTGGDFWQKHIFIPFLKKKRHIRSPANLVFIRLAKRSGSCEPSTQPVCQPTSPVRGLFPKAQRPAPLVGKACVESA